MGHMYASSSNMSNNIICVGVCELWFRMWLFDASYLASFVTWHICRGGHMRNDATFVVAPIWNIFHTSIKNWKFYAQVWSFLEYHVLCSLILVEFRLIWLVGCKEWLEHTYTSCMVGNVQSIQTNQDRHMNVFACLCVGKIFCITTLFGYETNILQCATKSSSNNVE